MWLPPVEGILESTLRKTTERHRKAKPSGVRDMKTKSADRACILVVDDHRSVLRTLGRQLETHFDIVTTTDPLEAVELSKTEPVNIVMTDYQMPIRNGVWLLEQVRKQEPEIHRFLLSADVVPNLEGHLRSGLVERFFPKIELWEATLHLRTLESLTPRKCSPPPG